MEYNLSPQRSNQKKKFEKIIEENDEKLIELEEKILDIRKSRKSKQEQDARIAILELEIQQEEIENDIKVKELAIKDLYFSEMQDNLKQKRMNKEISAQEYANEKNILKNIEIW